MKKRIYSVLIIILSLAFLLTTVGGTALGKEYKSKKLKLTHFVPEVSAYHKAMVYYSENVSKRTGGKLSFKIYPMGSLIKAKDTLEGVAKGLADMGFISFAYNPGDFPFNAASQFLPFTWNWENSMQVLDLGQSIWQKEVDNHNQMLISAQPNVGSIFFKKTVDDLNKPDLSGRRIVAHSTVGKVVELLGAGAVNMPVSEVPSAIRTGVIDGFFVSMQSYVNLDLVSDAPYVLYTGTGFGFLGIWLSINKDSFDKLPNEWQQIMIEEGKNAQSWYIKQVQQENIDKKQEALQKGATILELKAENIANWRKTVQPIYDEIIEKHGEPMRDFISKVDKIAGSSFVK